MSRLSLVQLFASFNIDISSSVLNFTTNDMQNDSRKVKQGDIFCAVKGSLADGRQHIDSAIANGCSLVISECDEENDHGLVSHITLENSNTLQICFYQLNSHLFTLCKLYYQQPQENFSVVGITGTNGKTSTCQLTAQLLEACQHSSAVIGTNGAGKLSSLISIENTTPGATELHQHFARFKDEDIEFVVMEVSSHALEQKRVTPELFEIAVFTNLSRDHLDYHGDMVNYADAKKKIFTQDSAQQAIVNVDDEIGREWITQLPNNTIAYGLDEQVKEHEYFVMASNVEHIKTGVKFLLESHNGQIEINSSLIGDFNIDNLLAAISILICKGVSLTEIAKAVELVKPITGRMELFTCANQTSAVVDYAHTPDALENAILACQQHCQGELWVVFGCGGDRDKGKRPLMGKIANKYAHHVVITNDNPRSETPSEIANDILVGCHDLSKVSVVLDREEAVLTTLTNAKAEDTVLLAGKGHEDYILMGQHKVHYDERATVQSYFAKEALL